MMELLTPSNHVLLCLSLFSPNPTTQPQTSSSRSDSNERAYYRGGYYVSGFYGFRPSPRLASFRYPQYPGSPVYYIYNPFQRQLPVAPAAPTTSPATTATTASLVVTPVAPRDGADGGPKR